MQHGLLLSQSALVATQKTPTKKALWMCCTEQGNKEKGVVVWNGGKSIVYGAFVLQQSI